MVKLFEATGRHGRAILVKDVTSTCMECGKNEKCLSFDSSNGEYSSMVFCKKCIDKFFEGHVSKSDYFIDLSNRND